MLSVRDAVGTAIAYIKEFADIMPSRDVRLEETQLSQNDEGDSIWLITLSLGDSQNPIMNTRSFKTFEIEADSGQVIAMKARSILGSSSR